MPISDAPNVPRLSYRHSEISSDTPLVVPHLCTEANTGSWSSKTSFRYFRTLRMLFFLMELKWYRLRHSSSHIRWYIASQTCSTFICTHRRGSGNSRGEDVGFQVDSPNVSRVAKTLPTFPFRPREGKGGDEGYRSLKPSHDQSVLLYVNIGA